MKRFVPVIFLCILCTSCAGLYQPPQEPYIERAKRALAVARTTYIAASGVYLQAKEDGLVEPEEALYIETLDGQLKEAYSIAMGAIEAADEQAAKDSILRIVSISSYLVQCLSDVLPYDTSRAIKIALMVVSAMVAN